MNNFKYRYARFAPHNFLSTDEGRFIVVTIVKEKENFKVRINSHIVAEVALKKDSHTWVVVHGELSDRLLTEIGNIVENKIRSPLSRTVIRLKNKIVRTQANRKQFASTVVSAAAAGLLFLLFYLGDR